MSITRGIARGHTTTVELTDPPTRRAHAHTPVGWVAFFRVAFGLVWVVDAILKWLPGFRGSLGSMLEQAAKAQPAWIREIFDLWTGLPHWEITTMAYASAATESFLALALVTGFARRSVYLFGAVYSLAVWAAGEGFGAPYQSGTTDVGAAVIYTFVFAALFLVDRSGPNPLSLDAYLEARLSWWHHIAEVGAHRVPEVRPA